MALPNHLRKVAYYAGYDEIELRFVVKILIREASGVLDGKPKVKWKRNDPVRKEKVEGTCDEAMETLLLLANHSQIPLWSIKSCGQTYSRGIDTIAKSCLHLYLMLNLFITTKEAGSPLEVEVDWDSARPKPESFIPEKKYTQCEKYKRMVQRSTWDSDHCATRRLHGNFFDLQTTRRGNYITEMRDLDILAEMDACQEHLKQLWRIMVVYDLVTREEGEDSD